MGKRIDSVIPWLVDETTGLVVGYVADDGTEQGFSGGAGVTDGDKGDISVSASGGAWSIDAGAVTPAKMANMATASLIGRATAGTGTPEVLSAAQARALLSLVVGTDVQAFDADLAQIAALVDPNADRILFWDDSASAWTHLTLGTNLSITGTVLNAATGAASTVRAVSATTDTLLSTDAENIVDYTNAGAIAVSITTAMSGLATTLTWPTSAGTITITPTGVTLNGSGSALVLSAAGGAVSIIPTGANAFRVVGSVGEIVLANVSDMSANAQTFNAAANYAAMYALLQGNGSVVDSVGYRGLPLNSQSAAYTMVLADNGKVIYHPSADTTARTWTIPANASVAFPIGATIMFDNDASAGAITIAITTDTLVLVGAAGSTGSRTLASGGRAVATKVTATRWRISGGAELT